MSEQAPPDPAPAQWLTLKEAEAHFGRVERTLRAWIAQGKLHARKVERDGSLWWEVWTGDGPPAECIFVGREGEKDTPPDPPPAADVLTIARHQYDELLSRHERVCAEFGRLQSQVTERLSRYEEERRADREETATGSRLTAALAEEVRQLAAAGEGLSRDQGRIQGRQRVLTAMLAVLAVALAVVGAWLLGVR